MSEFIVIHSTPQLSPGDLVLTHGMRVRLGEGKTWVDPQSGETVYAFPGTVENMSQVEADGVVPLAWLKTQRWVDGDGWVTDLTNHWTIQGNRLASWHVLVNATVTEQDA